MKALVLECDWDPRDSYPVTALEKETRKATQACHVWRHPRFAMETVPDPEPKSREVVIKVRRCGVCGSDTHCYETDDDGYIIFSGPVALPCVLGHEFTGEVVAVGKEVRNLRIGDLVAAEGMLHCGLCEACRNGHPNQCPTLDMLGFSAPGAYADYVAIEERFCWSLNGIAERTGSAAQALELGALVEPISCSFNGIWVAGDGMRPGDHVAVFGAGPIGLGAIDLARAAGAASIVAFDVVKERLDVALACGADEAWDPVALAADGGSPSEVIRRITGGWGAGVLVEAAGAALHTMPEIEKAFAPGGQMIYLGRTGERAPVMLDVLVTGAAKIVGSRGHCGMGCYPQVIRMLERSRLRADEMITTRRPFSEVLAALEQSTTRLDGKIMVDYDL